MSKLEEVSGPMGKLALQIIAHAQDANSMGDIYGGWLVSQMDLAGSVCCERRAQGRVATVAIDKMAFLSPVKVGSTVSFYADFVSTGRSSLQVSVEVWASSPGSYEKRKVTDGIITFVAIDKNGRTRALPQS